MEFRLNKIDLEVRDRIKEQTKSGKVHSKTNLSIEKDKGQGNSKQETFKEKLKKNKKIKVKAVKYFGKQDLNINATKEEIEGKSSMAGYIIDTKK
ncbi:hypothetical protein FDF74_01420 [Clostridium niameyense]|uniref:Uncharacterized protein n=1 Tax=Clostridium niameyense TaxID=1622073 RepID=A0A6M0R7X8_9CLOT|nr:hypothetical protein [Clostridium niameyense]NEZ45867.1 hypothetical protein [Clostridium niameyense]